MRARTGLGAAGRPGTRMAYTAEHLSLAMLGYFVHLDPDDPPKDLVLVMIDIPESVSRISIGIKQLPKTWRQTPPPPELADIGDEFARHGRAAILIVPSALAPTEFNWLINPLHSDLSKFRVYPAEPLEYDRRFFT